jgi:fucose 4-O-acetylase-like acetyltransferase
MRAASSGVKRIGSEDERMAPKEKRLIWIDAAKGLAISLVVVGHVMGGMMARGWLDSKGPFEDVYNYIYLFHMPLFFMLSGALCIDSIRNNPLGAFWSRTGSIAWPYFLWNVVIASALLPLVAHFNDVAQSEIDWSERLRQALTGDLSWFLWTLYVMQVILIPVARAPIILLFLASVVACFGLQGLQLGTFDEVIDYMPFLLFGAMLRPFLHRFKVSRNWRPLLASFVTFLLMAVALLHGWTSYKLVWILCGVGGSLASIYLVQNLGTWAESRLAQLGIASLAIFVLHPYFQGAARVLVLRTIGSSTFWQLLIATIIGIGGPFIVWRFAERHGMPWLFRLQLTKSAGGDYTQSATSPRSSIPGSN